MTQRNELVTCYSNDLQQQIAQRAFNLRQLLRDENIVTVEKEMPLLMDHVLAADTVKKYLATYDVNYASKEHLTLLHLLVRFAPDLASMIISHPDFVRINYETTAFLNLKTSALDLAFTGWLEGRCSQQLVLLLLKYGSQPRTDFMPEICQKVIFSHAPKHTVDEVVKMLALLGQYGFSPSKPREKFMRDWFADETTVAAVAAKGFGKSEQENVLFHFLLDAFKQYLQSYKAEPELLVELTKERLATSRVTLYQSNVIFAAPTPLVQEEHVPKKLTI